VSTLYLYRLALLRYQSWVMCCNWIINDLGSHIPRGERCMVGSSLFQALYFNLIPNNRKNHSLPYAWDRLDHHKLRNHRARVAGQTFCELLFSPHHSHQRIVCIVNFHSICSYPLTMQSWTGFQHCLPSVWRDFTATSQNLPSSSQTRSLGLIPRNVFSPRNRSSPQSLERHY